MTRGGSIRSRHPDRLSILQPHRACRLYRARRAARIVFPRPWRSARVRRRHRCARGRRCGPGGARVEKSEDIDLAAAYRVSQQLVIAEAANTRTCTVGRRWMSLAHRSWRAAGSLFLVPLGRLRRARGAPLRGTKFEEPRFGARNAAVVAIRTHPRPRAGNSARKEDTSCPARFPVAYAVSGVLLTVLAYITMTLAQ